MQEIPKPHERQEPVLKATIGRVFERHYFDPTIGLRTNISRLLPGGDLELRNLAPEQLYALRQVESTLSRLHAEVLASIDIG